ncbi:hypothetical protein [Saccharicrinis fermentans]|nr:hypothetical protein [Saccharicrinis fermentans]
MEFLLQLLAELIKGNEIENTVNTIEDREIVEVEENTETQNIFGMMHFH